MEKAPSSSDRGLAAAGTTGTCEFKPALASRVGDCPVHVCLMPNLLPSIFTYGFFSFIDAADVRHANTIVEWGINPLTAWPGLQAPHLLEAKKRGAKLIVIDPRFTDLAAKADIWLQIHPGTDGALALGMMNVLIEEEIYDKEFVDKWTLGFDQLAERVKEFPPDRVAEITWIPTQQIIEATRLMANNRPSTLTISLGVCMHTNGMQNGRAIAFCLAFWVIWMPKVVFSATVSGM